MRQKNKNIIIKERDFLLHNIHLRSKFKSPLFGEKLNTTPAISKFYKTIQIEENRKMDEFYSNEES